MPHERQHLIRSLFDEYIDMYSSRDERLLSRFSDNFSGYAGSSDILVTNKEEWMRITKQDFAQVPGKICIEMLDLSLQDLSDDIVAVTAFFHIHLPIPESILSQETARLTLIFRHEGVDWKIAYSGISIPYGLAHDNEIYPMTRLEERNLELERIIATRTAELAEINKNLEILSNTDGLTGIANRRHFDHMLIQEWNRCQRANTPLSLIMLDIDHFKQFNDLYGHLTGDDCLKTLAHALSQVGRRAGELAARYGGEEFTLILPETNIDNAAQLAEKIRRNIAETTVLYHGYQLPQITASFGVASYSQQIHDPAHLINAADKALYHAKNSGRNCVRLFKDNFVT